jgi:hypothetical protein
MTVRFLLLTADFLDPQGYQGPRGPRGDQGQQGVEGKNGPPGILPGPFMAGALDRAATPDHAVVRSRALPPVLMCFRVQVSRATRARPAFRVYRVGWESLALLAARATLVGFPSSSFAPSRCEQAVDGTR